MKKIVIFGNSGSGKSTLAKKLSASEDLSHLDLDSVAWRGASPPERKSIVESKVEIDAFTEREDRWVVEGCYSDLLEIVIPLSTEIIFLDLPIEACIRNAKQRPWEPEKYLSKQAQDANLDMLISWISEYYSRVDTFSHASHEALFRRYDRKKTLYTNNV